MAYAHHTNSQDKTKGYHKTAKATGIVLIHENFSEEINMKKKNGEIEKERKKLASSGNQFGPVCVCVSTSFTILPYAITCQEFSH